MIDLRKLEKSEKFGYFFYIKFSGKNFDSFDENKNSKSVKGVFIKIMNRLGITWAKGVQQAARVDGNVSANENVLYINTKCKIDKEKLRNEFNLQSKEIEILKIEKTLPDLVVPELVEKREYIYSYPPEKITATDEEIISRCTEFDGRMIYTDFTDVKGKLLKNQHRDVEVRLKKGKLIFTGDSFLPKQVRIMSSYIFTGEKKIFPAKYLILNKVIWKKEVENIIIGEIKNIKVDKIEKIEKMNDIYFFFVKKENRPEVIGKRGKNIKKLRKNYGKVIIKDAD